MAMTATDSNGTGKICLVIYALGNKRQVDQSLMISPAQVRLKLDTATATHCTGSDGCFETTTTATIRFGVYPK